MSLQSQPIALELIVRNHPGVMTHICGGYLRVVHLTSMVFYVYQ